MQTIHLHGHLKTEFGGPYKFDVKTAAEALRALNCAFPGKFVKALQTGSFEVVRGDFENGTRLDLDLVTSFNLGAAEMHLIPVAEGAADHKGIAKTILGVALIGGAIFMSGGSLAAPLGMMGETAFGIGGMSVTWGNIALIGLGLTLAGVATLMSKPAESTVSTDSFTINGPSNTAEQGSAIPLIYGETMTGSVGISFDADIEDIGAYQGVDFWDTYQGGWFASGGYA